MNPLPLKRINDEVYVATDEIVRLDRHAIEFIRDCALRNPRGRARICAHKDSGDNLHEMLIGIAPGSYVRPHRHHSKIESFHLIEGNADIVILSEQGSIEDVIELGPNANFYYRLDSPRYHTLLISSPVLVIHETTNGPFDPAQTDWAAFSPVEGAAESSSYTSQLRQKVSGWKASR
jgi:cupin fold WbuC family metalloprotein